jgi:hypothetical protein
LYLLVFLLLSCIWFLYLNYKFSFLCRLIAVSYHFLPHVSIPPPITLPSVISHLLLYAVPVVLLCMSQIARSNSISNRAPDRHFRRFL